MSPFLCLSLRLRWRRHARPLAEDDVQLASDQDIVVRQLVQPVLRLEPRRKTGIKPAHDRRQHRPHLVQSQRPTDAVAWAIVEGHVCALDQLEVLSTSLCDLRAFARKPALGPERLRLGRKVAWITVNCGRTLGYVMDRPKTAYCSRSGSGPQYRQEQHWKIDCENDVPSKAQASLSLTVQLR
jgi:hypothetical protein